MVFRRLSKAFSDLRDASANAEAAMREFAFAVDAAGSAEAEAECFDVDTSGRLHAQKAAASELCRFNS